MPIRAIWHRPTSAVGGERRFQFSLLFKLTLSVVFYLSPCHLRAESPTPNAIRPIVVLQPPTPSNTAVDKLLVREVVRQAFLLTAREEFHVATRDLAVHEYQEANNPNEFVFRIEVRHPDRTHVKVELELVSSDRQAPTWVGEFNGSEEKQLEAALEQTSKWTQNEFVDWLKSVNMPVVPLLAQERHSIANQNQDNSNFTLDFISQIQRARELHPSLLREPSSTQLLSDLARAYALLGSVTEIHWGCDSKMFKARSLLYAHRAIRSGPESADAAWAASLAWALCGRDDLCLREMERAKSQNESEIGATSPPWADSLKSFARWDDDTLRKLVEQKAPLAAYLRFLAMEMCGSSQQRIASATAVIDVHPECFRAAATVAEEEHSSLRERVGMTQFMQYLATLPADILHSPGLPSYLKEAAENTLEQAGEQETELSDELIDATASLVETMRQIPSTDDHSEPSLSLLGMLASNLHFVHIVQIRQTQWYMYNESFHELLRRHPCCGFLDVYQFDSMEAQNTLNQVGSTLQNFPVCEAAWRALGKLEWLNATAQRQLIAMIRTERDNTVADLIARLKSPLSDVEMRETLAILDRISPNCPEALIAHIKRDWDDVLPSATELINGTDNARILKTFADRFEITAYGNASDRADALKCWKKIAQTEPSNDSYVNLANHYKKFDQDEQWKETMLACLELVDLGNDHATVNASLADWHMKRQEWSDAKPYALAASDSGTEAGLMCASRCMEGLQDWAAAEKLAKENSERHSDWIAWYLFCQRTGHGSLKEAREFCEQLIERMSSRERSTNQRLGVFMQLEGKTEIAARDYRRFSLTAQDENGYWSTLNMLLLGQLGKASERDKIISELINKTGNPYPGFIAEQLRRPLDSEAPPLTDSELEFLFGVASTRNDGTNWAYFIAKVLQQRKKPRESIKWLQRAASSPYVNVWTCTFASAELRKMNEPIPPRRVTELDASLIPALELIQKAFAYHAQNFNSLAADTAKEAVAAAPDWPVAHYHRASLAFRSEEFQLSNEEYSKTLETVPKQPYVLLWRGYAREKLNDREGALQDSELSRKIVPIYRLARSRAESLKNPPEEN